MSELLKIVLSLSISGTLLFFIILALKTLYKNKLCKRWQYYIWLIVVVRMLLPFTPEITLIGSAFEYLGNTNVGTIQTVSSADNTQSHFGLDDSYITLSLEQQAPKSSAPLLSIQAIISKVYENLWILWAAIAFALLIRKITIYQSFVRFVKVGRSEVSDIEILNMLADVGERIGIKRPVELFTNPLISSPMLLGFFRPYIILPSIELERTELFYIMWHEMTHYKYLDMFYKWLVQITICLHWFNPFAYLIAKEINKGCELSCDEAIIRTMDKDEKKAYGDTLLNSLKVMGNYNDKLATVTLTEGAEQLKERLDAIMKFKKASKITTSIMLVITLILAMGAIAIGAYDTPKTPTTPWETMGGNNGKSYTYSQESYYQAPYIFEIGRNVNENWDKSYPDKTTLTLSDNKTITISFAPFCKEYAKDEKALKALKPLMEKLIEKFEGTSLPMERPLIVSVHNVGNSDLNKLAEEYYLDGAMNKFVAIFPTLDKSIQKMYCDKMYKDGKIAFFASTLRVMDADTINYCAEKIYIDNKVNFFSTIVPFLSDQAKTSWIAKSSKDEKRGILAVLTKQVSYSNNNSIQGNSNGVSNTQKPITISSRILPNNTKELAISFDIDNGGVEILPAITNEITASYDSEYYNVDIANKNGKWNISICGKASMMGKTDYVQLYVPNIKCNMDVNVLNGNFSYALPENCADEISITAKNAGIDFTSKNKYKNSSISLIATNKDFIKYEQPIYPNYFTKTNSGFEYTNGMAKNKINISLTGYTSVNFND